MPKQSQPPEDINLIRWIHKNNPLAYSGLGILVILAFGALLFSDQIGVLWFQDGFFSNAYTEGVSIIITILVLDRLAANRDEQRQKQELIVDLGGTSNEFAKRAARILDVKGWHSDGSLKGKLLQGAELQNAKLFYADLRGAILSSANLQNTVLVGAKLQRAQLEGANLRQAYLGEADLRGAQISYADFRGADLTRVQLRGAQLTELEFNDDLLFDKDTILPDGTKYTSPEDLKKFIDGTWKPDWLGDDG